MGMTKLKLCNRIAKRTDVKHLPAVLDYKTIVDAALDEIMNILSEGSKIEIRGFGCFKVINRKKRIGRNPRTGQIYIIEACPIPSFKFSKEAYKIFEQKKSLKS